jgi:hypothetical protein
LLTSALGCQLEVGKVKPDVKRVVTLRVSAILCPGAQSTVASVSAVL